MSDRQPSRSNLALIDWAGIAAVAIGVLIPSTQAWITVRSNQAELRAQLDAATQRIERLENWQDSATRSRRQDESK